MDRCYSSDEDIAWGPKTLREIKKDFRNPPVEKIKSRHSFWKSYSSKENLISEDSENMQKAASPDENNACVMGLLEDVTNKCNISATSAQYFTANETLSSGSNVCPTKYTRATNQHLQLHTTQWKPEYNVDNFQLTLISSYSDDSLNVSCQKDRNSSVISISSDDSEEQEYISTNEYVTIGNVKRELSIASENESDTSIDLSNHSQHALNCSQELYDGLSVLDDSLMSHGHEIEPKPCDNDLLEETSQYPQNVFNDVDCENGTVLSSENPKYPSLALDDEWNDSGLSQKSLDELKYSDDREPDLDNTLERVEWLLSGKPLPNKKEQIQDKVVQPTSIGKSDTSRIPVLAAKPTCDFKVPQCSSHKKLLTPKPKVLNNNLKNIVSPVGLYIKYSSQPILKQNVEMCEMKTIECSNTAPRSTNKCDSVPKNIYKPSKNQITTSRKNLFLPPSIGKMVQEPHCIKHEGRINRAINESRVDYLLSTETDLTTASINESNLDDANTSILVNKNTFK